MSIDYNHSGKNQNPPRSRDYHRTGRYFIFGNIPSILSYGPWKDISVFGKNIFDAFDYISGNILFMLTALGSALFVGFVMKDEAKDELLYKGNQTTVNIWFAYVKYLVPLVILLIFISNLF